ncbi:MAG: hypothetical protein A4E23_00387 [Methanomethylovorans sp. PtaU1.Bin073]|nr:MAG: hypothetical protein A4E23_00387 [Methanomethylovorans sp. PtaU1.Bin073]
MISEPAISITIPGYQRYLSFFPFGPDTERMSFWKVTVTPSGMLITFFISLAIEPLHISTHMPEAVHQYFSHVHHIVT